MRLLFTDVTCSMLKSLRDWITTVEEIYLAGDDLPEILRARDEARAGVGMTPDELRAYLEVDDA